MVAEIINLSRIRRHTREEAEARQLEREANHLFDVAGEKWALWTIPRFEQVGIDLLSFDDELVLRHFYQFMAVAFEKRAKRIREREQNLVASLAARGLPASVFRC